MRQTNVHFLEFDEMNFDKNVCPLPNVVSLLLIKVADLTEVSISCSLVSILVHQFYVLHKIERLVGI